MKHLFYTFFLLFCNSIFAQNATFYVGSYTVNTASEGIYSYNFNLNTGEISNKKLIGSTVNPSFITLSADKKKLFTVSENGKKGVIKSFSIQKNGNLNFINLVNSEGAGPCHIQLNKKNNKLVVSNYGGGTIALYNVSKKGDLENAFQVFNHNIQQDRAHAHSSKFLKNNLSIHVKT